MRKTPIIALLSILVATVSVAATVGAAELPRFPGTYTAAGSDTDRVDCRPRPTRVNLTAGAYGPLAEFGKAIESRLDGNVVGYAYALSEYGRFVGSGAGGWAQKPEDGCRPMTADTRLLIASVSKNISAVAVQKLLDANGLSPFDYIGPWLPEEWPRGPGFEVNGGLRFADLLTHRSGVNQTIKKLDSDGDGKLKELSDGLGSFQAANADQTQFSPNTWDGMRILVENGIEPEFINPPDSDYYGPYSYKNANYSLFSVITPRLWLASGQMPILQFADLGDPAMNALVYEAYVTDKVLEPIGVIGAHCHVTDGDDAALYYDIYAPDAPGSKPTSDEPSTACPAKGWYLSAMELANFVANVRYNEDLFPHWLREEMDQHRLGWSKNADTEGYAGFHWHGGDFFWGYQPEIQGDLEGFKTEAGGASRELHSCVMKMPHGIEGALVVNSSVAYPRSVCGILIEAHQEWLQGQEIGKSIGS